MNPAERKSQIIALLARIDQDIVEARQLVHDENLSPAERQQADGHLAFCESAARHTEILLRKC